MSLPYKRIMLKLSGEMLGGNKGYGIEGEALELIAGEIASLHNLGAEVGVVIGGGNIFRGSFAEENWEIDRASADYMGMLATVINGLALQGILESKYEINTRVMTAISMQALAEPYIRRKADKHLSKRRIVVFVAGLGNPYFTTDTAASLRAREIGAEIILKGTKVDGVYDSDPKQNVEAVRFESLSYFEVLSKKLHVMDATAITMCMESNIPILVFKMDKPGCVIKAVKNHDLGTLVHSRS